MNVGQFRRLLMSLARDADKQQHRLLKALPGLALPSEISQRDQEDAAASWLHETIVGFGQAQVYAQMSLGLSDEALAKEMQRFKTAGRAALAAKEPQR